MSRRILLYALASLAVATLGAAMPAVLLATQNYVEGQLIVQFKEGVLDVPDTDETTFRVDEVIFSDPADGEVLVAAGVEELRIIAPYWRNVEDRQYFDVHGNSVDGLVDFKDIYLLILNAATDTNRAHRLLDESDITS
jgi:hypothetical protein